MVLIGSKFYHLDYKTQKLLLLELESWPPAVGKQAYSKNIKQNTKPENTQNFPRTISMPLKDWLTLKAGGCSISSHPWFLSP